MTEQLGCREVDHAEQSGPGWSEAGIRVQRSICLPRKSRVSVLEDEYSHCHGLACWRTNTPIGSLVQPARNCPAGLPWLCLRPWTLLRNLAICIPKLLMLYWFSIAFHQTSLLCVNPWSLEIDWTSSFPEFPAMHGLQLPNNCLNLGRIYISSL